MKKYLAVILSLIMIPCLFFMSACEPPETRNSLQILQSIYDNNKDGSTPDFELTIDIFNSEDVKIAYQVIKTHNGDVLEGTNTSYSKNDDNNEFEIDSNYLLFKSTNNPTLPNGYYKLDTQTKEYYSYNIDSYKNATNEIAYLNLFNFIFKYLTIENPSDYIKTFTKSGRDITIYIEKTDKYFEDRINEYTQENKFSIIINNNIIKQVVGEYHIDYKDDTYASDVSNKIVYTINYANQTITVPDLTGYEDINA